MKRKLTWGTVLFLTLFALRAETTVNVFSFPDRNQVGQALHIHTGNYGPLVCIEGEISAVTADWISLRQKDRGEITFSLKDAEVYVNGQVGLCTALRPIAPGLNFAARLYIDHEGVLRLVDGWYVGMEAEVLAVDPECRFLTLRPLDTPETNRFIFSPLLPTTSPLPAPGEVCFFLFDWEHRVRRIISAP
ncbi:MAG: hypothetical protein GX770_05045 [Firmicutes bacterium]|nr:hypothetical protein [Bacillota bacterium]